MGQETTERIYLSNEQWHSLSSQAGLEMGHRASPRMGRPKGWYVATVIFSREPEKFVTCQRYEAGATSLAARYGR